MTIKHLKQFHQGLGKGHIALGLKSENYLNLESSLDKRA